MKTIKTRHQFYLPDDLSAKLDDLAGKPGNSKTTILTEALRAWLDRKAVNELDERFAPRMDRQQRSLQRVETTLNIAAESLDLFIQHQMTIVAHQPAFEAETAQLGLRRRSWTRFSTSYRAFWTPALSKRRAAPCSTASPADDRREQYDSLPTIGMRDGRSAFARHRLLFTGWARTH